MLNAFNIEYNHLFPYYLVYFKAELMEAIEILEEFNFHTI